MKTHLVQCSLVIAGEENNPSILNPDFLTIRKIVPRSWRDKVEQAITVPPFSVVSYRNGVSIRVESKKIQITDHNPPATGVSKRISDIAKKYVTTLPHVRYTALGINFDSLTDVENPEKWLKDRFLKPGPWSMSDRSLDAVGLRLVYPIRNGGRLILSLDAGRARHQDLGEEERPVIIAKANFHRDCRRYPSENDIVTFLENLREDHACYQGFLDNLLAEEE
jgi:hypothetical protein